MTPTARAGRSTATFAAAASLGLVLAACGSGSAAIPSQRSASTDVTFNSCASVACTGTLSGAAYTIVMPKKWNGTLLLYSHGYREAAAAPPDFAPVDTKAEAAPGYGDSSDGSDAV